MKPVRPIVLTALLSFLVLGLNGCFLQVRKLRDDNNMLKERVLQYQQDMNALEIRYQQVQTELVAANKERDDLRQQLELVKERNAVFQRTMSQADRTQAEVQIRDLEERVKRENELKLKIDDLSARVETLTNEKALMESELQSARSKVGQLEPTVTELSQKVREVSGEMEKIRIERDEIRAERDDFQRQLDAVKSDATTAATELQTVSGQLREKDVEIAALKRELEATKAEVSTQSAAIKATTEQATGLTNALKQAFADEITKGSVEVKNTDGLRVVLTSDILFEPGTVLLSAEGGRLLGKLATVLAKNEFTSLQAQGHTDSTPVKNMPFIDNWDLAAARASAATRFLARQPGVPASKLSAASFAFFSPVASNDTPEGRRQNRRVEMVIQP